MKGWLLPLSLILGLTACGEGEAAEARGGGDPATGQRRSEAPPAERSHWRRYADPELEGAIRAARAQAGRSGKRVLVEFGATWCPDCREVARLSELEPARSVLRERYISLNVDVGRWDRHRELLARWGIRRIAALVVLDPATGERVAQTTMEPISERSGFDSEGLAAWLRSPTSE